MRLLIVSNQIELGGCLLNAFDFALATRERGHDVVVFGSVRDTQRGPLAQMVRPARLPLVLATIPVPLPEPLGPGGIDSPRVDTKFLIRL